MRFSDETLMAYADGELDAATRAAIEAEMAVDPDLARAIERHRALAGRVRGAYAGVLDETVPERLAALVAKPAASNVTPLAAHRVARAPVAARSRLPQWMAVAAMLVLGVGVSLFMINESDPWAETATGLVARGELDAALTQQLAGSLGTGGPQLGISFRDRDGAWCRTFHLDREAPVAGLACRSGAEWQLRVMADAGPREAGLRTAGAMPLAVLEAVDAAIEGEPADAAAERAARDSGWQVAPNVAE